ncbi:helix-turn-helix transcriptional regulator [Pelagibius sp. CAU 1746]|uniref:helix-turn-helix domain-containing protein n=1 Tax=Pelagibius sp. CAU 1746 TaxID=3140370 RepID=UPI00325A6112
MPSLTVAEYLANQLRACGKTQKQVADEIGYPSPNVITMMKRGQTKVPIEKVPSFAKALGVDPAHFLRIVMREYYPENWRVLRDALGFVVTRNERELVEVVRTATGDTDPRIDPERLTDIGKIVQSGIARPR